MCALMLLMMGSLMERVCSYSGCVGINIRDLSCVSSGEKSSHSILNTTTVSSLAECAVDCVNMDDCAAFFYHQTLLMCILNSEQVSQLNLTSEAGWIGYNLPANGTYSSAATTSNTTEAFATSSIAATTAVTSATTSTTPPSDPTTTHSILTTDTSAITTSATTTTLSTGTTSATTPVTSETETTAIPATSPSTTISATTTTPTTTTTALTVTTTGLSTLSPTPNITHSETTVTSTGAFTTTTAAPTASTPPTTTTSPTTSVIPETETTVIYTTTSSMTTSVPTTIQTSTTSSPAATTAVTTTMTAATTTVITNTTTASTTTTTSTAAAAISLWVDTVVGFSSQYRAARWSADKIIGAPDVYPAYGDDPNAWASAEWTGIEWIEVQFSQTLFITRVDIYETFHAGGVREVSARNPSTSTWDVLWQVSTVSVITSSRIFSPPTQQPTYKTDQLRIEVDCGPANHWVELDAVKVTGHA